MPDTLPFLLRPSARPLWRVLLLLLAGVTSYFAFSTTPHEVVQIEDFDKFEHIAAFFSLAVSAAMGWPPGLQATAWLATALLGYGVFIELVQSQIPGRTASAFDVLADGVGVACGLALVMLVRRRRHVPPR